MSEALGEQLTLVDEIDDDPWHDWFIALPLDPGEGSQSSQHGSLTPPQSATPAERAAA
jgi:hypothetical protein